VIYERLSSSGIEQLDEVFVPESVVLPEDFGVPVECFPAVAFCVEFWTLVDCPHELSPETASDGDGVSSD